MRILFLLFILFGVSACYTHPVSDEGLGTDEVGVRNIPIDDSAYSGSSINVVAGTRQMLYTDSIHQYAGYYDENGYVVLAKRRLGEDTWEKRKTEFSAEVEDAHNTISLIVDGDGYLHLTWGHHDTPLRYSVSKGPGNLVMGDTRSMLGTEESSVTYPQFFRLSDGDLLFLYRDGSSGNGRLVLNHYDLGEKNWARRQSNLIDGEGERSAYWDMAIGRNDVLHLAWNWRESPDVATNHDLLYAQSNDGGKTWQRSDGEIYALPITEATAEVSAAIDQNHNLMNPPSMAVGDDGRPYIMSYWSRVKGDNPSFNLVYPDSGGWQVLTGPKAQKNFKLQGGGTKRPPISRAVLFINSNSAETQAHLIYRSDFYGGRVVGATVNDLRNPQWTFRYLTDYSVGAWEPSADPSQWQRMEQAHLLLQNVAQVDGDDQTGSQKEATPISLLLWSPDWEAHLSKYAASGTQEKVKRESDDDNIDLLSPEVILDYAEKVANWQWENMPSGWHFHPKGWGVCPLYIGTLDIAPYLEKEGFDGDTLKQKMLARARENNFEPRDHSRYDADGYCVTQAYLRLYKQYLEQEMLSPSKKRFDYILQNPSEENLDWGYPNSRDRWSWSDALFMGPMSWLMMWEATEDERYLNFMNQEWWATTDRLYREEMGFYFRDESYLDLRESNGKTIHWARGTAAPRNSA